MKRTAVAESRARSTDPLDTAEENELAVQRRRGRKRKMLDYVDPDVATGQWTWEWSATDLEFRGQRPRK
jgi:hypothetical protein